MKNNTEISKELKRLAIGYNLCSEWTDGWGEPDLDELAEKYVNGIDFCIQHNYPSLEYIKKYFNGVAEKHGVFTDCKINLENPEIAILNGNCTGEIILNGFVSRSIYVRHNSKVRIVIKNSANAFIRVHDNTEVIIDNRGANKVFVYKYGNKCQVFTNGNVLVRGK